MSRAAANDDPTLTPDTAPASRVAVVANKADQQLITAILAGTNAEAIAATAAELARGIAENDFAAAIITDEALGALDREALDRALDGQPPWLDFPFILLAERGSLARTSHLLVTLGQVAIVEQPIDEIVLRNAAASALRARTRQQEAGAYLLQRQGSEEHLRQLTATLETRVRKRMSELRSLNERLVREVREREAAETRLRESEELYRYTVELSDQRVWGADADGTITAASLQFYLATGTIPDVAPHEAWVNALHPEDRDEVVAKWEESVASGSLFLAEYRMRVADGSYRFIRSTGAPRRDENGNVVHWYGIARDIHEQRQADAARLEAEAQLRESEELYRYTVELSHQIAWTATPRGTMLTVSQRFYDITGLATDVDPNTAWVESVHPDDLRQLSCLWQCVLESGRAFDAPFRMRVADGSYRSFLARAAPRFDENGQIIRWYGYTEDVTEQKQADTARREAEERYRLAAKATNDAIWDLDLVNDQIQWAAGETAFFGYRASDEMTSLRWWEDRVHPDDRQRVSESLHLAIAGSQSHWSANYRFRTASGDYADVYDQGFIIRDPDGRAVRAVGAMADVTEHSRAEAELRRIQAELIHVSRLSAMGAMASTLAHEINQPLTAVSSYIRGSSRLLEQSAIPAAVEVRDALEAAEQATLRAGHIVRRLRELVARGNVSTRAEELPKLIHDANVIAFVDAHLLGVTHRVELDPKVLWVEVDPIQIQQVLINLVRNALQAMENQPRRELVIKTSAISKSMAQVSVSDTGTGLLPEVRDALFSTFHTTKGEGMGIGLSISRTIVEAHGGKIWADDAPGGGAIFRFTLPRADPPATKV